MSKKAKAKKLMASGLLLTTLAGGLPISAFAETPTAVVQTGQGDSLHDQVGKNLKTALGMLNDTDFTKMGTFEDMSKALMDAYNIVYGVNSYEDIDKDKQDVEDALGKINSSYNSIVGRIQHAINGLEVQFNNGSLEGKEIAVQQLEQIIKEETDLKFEYVNKTTVDAATKILDTYKLKLELARAVHEAKYTEQLLKDYDFTQKGSYEYLSSFIRAAVQRVDGVRSNGIENADTKYVYDVLDKANRSYNSIVGRIQHAINGLEVQFAYGGLDGQKIAVEQLEQIIDEETNLNYEYANKTTVDAATKVLEEYKAKLIKPQVAEELTGTKQEQLNYGLQEVALTKEMLENADFTKQGQWELMSSYISAAVDRAGWLRENGVADEKVKPIYDELAKVNSSYNSVVGRIQHAINGVKVQFNNGGLEGQEIAVSQLDQIIKDERDTLKYEYANKTTVDSATKFLDEYKLKLELARAVHEAKLAENMLKDADFTVYGNWELMASYIGAAVQRVNGVRYNGIENADTKYVYDTLAKVNNSYNSIVGRIQNATNGIKLQFEQGGTEGQQIAFDQLKQIIAEEKPLGYVNEKTLASAEKFLNSYTRP